MKECRKAGKDSYEDILYLPHHTSVVRPRMPLADRAAQFSPFAALSGYEDAIRETARITQEQNEDSIQYEKIDDN